MTVQARYRAMVLVDADRSSGAAAAARAGVAARTLVEWRKSLASDPELAGYYARETQLAIGRYRADFSATLACALAKMRDLIPQATVEDMTVLLNIATHCGELLVQADALVPQKDPDATPVDRKRTSNAAGTDVDPFDQSH